MEPSATSTTVTEPVGDRLQAGTEDTPVVDRPAPLRRLNIQTYLLTYLLTYWKYVRNVVGWCEWLQWGCCWYWAWLTLRAAWTAPTRLRCRWRRRRWTWTWRRRRRWTVLSQWRRPMRPPPCRPWRLLNLLAVRWPKKRLPWYGIFTAHHTCEHC